jgi:hypothetical protein
MLTKAEILKAAKLRHEDVEVKEWGGTVRISEMTAGAYDKYQRSLYKVKGSKVEQDLTDMTTSYLQACIVDDDGNPLFTLDEIKQLPAKPITRLYDIAQKVNGDNVESKEEIAKNSEGGPED